MSPTLFQVVLAGAAAATTSVVIAIVMSYVLTGSWNRPFVTRVMFAFGVLRIVFSVQAALIYGAPYAMVELVAAVILLWLWYFFQGGGPRRKRRLRKVLGAKAHALRAKLAQQSKRVRAARPTVPRLPMPRPALPSSA